MKKKILSKLFIIGLLPGMFSLSSCLKDSRYVDFSKAGTLVELPLAATSVAQFGSYDISSTPVPLKLVVNVASSAPLSAPLNVTLGVDAAALTAYNTKTGKSLVLLPSTNYDISGLKGTVPANQRTVTLNFSIHTDGLDPLSSYGLPVSITDAGGQKISNYKTLIFVINVKNQYDGNYHVTGVRIHPTLGNFDFDYNADLSTTGATSVAGPVLADLGEDITITVNPDNTVTLSGNANRDVFPTAGQTNVYDPATKTFHLHYYYNTAAPRYITEDLQKN